MDRNWRRVIVGVVLAVVFLGSFVAGAEVRRRVWPKQTIASDGTLTFVMADAAVAQFTFSVAAGSPDGSIAVYGRQEAGGADTLIATVGVISGTKTYICDAMGLMEVRLSSHSTGAIGVEASSR